MRRTLNLMSVVVALVAATTLAFAQPPANPNQPNQQGGGRGGPFGGGLGGPEIMRMMGAFQPPVVVTTEKFLFIIRTDTVFQLDINTLEILHKQELPPPKMPFGFGPQAGPPGANPQPPPAGGGQ